MKAYETNKIRNVAITGHGSEGKTTLTEAMLYNAKASERFGRVEDGTTTTDYDQEEIKRQISISTAIAPCEWKGYKLNIIDTPGYFDFVGELLEGIRVADSAVIVVSAVSGVVVGTEKAWDYSERYNIPKLFFVNQMDRENANFSKVLDQLKERYGTSIVPFQVPIIDDKGFKGFVNVVDLVAKEFKGKEVEDIDIPSHMNDEVQSIREMILEAVAESDDELLEKYFAGEELSNDEIHTGLRKGVLSGSIVPVLCGSALSTQSVALLMDTILEYCPSPADRPAVEGENIKTGEVETRSCDINEPFSAFVFKTVADPFVGKLSLFKVYSGTFSSDSSVYNSNKEKNEKVGQIYYMRGKKQINTDKIVAGDIGAVAKLQVTTTGDTLCDAAHPIKLEGIEFPEPSISLAVEPKAKGDEEKISSGLARLTEEDPTFTVDKNSEVNQVLISGVGELHLEVITKRLQNKFGVEVNLSEPKVAYRETIRKSVKAEGKHKKQSGGHGQYGHVWIEFEPAAEGEGDFVFVDKIVGGVVPRQYIPAVEKGLRECIEKGVLAGYPVVNLKCTLYDGSFHTVDSSEMAFKVAASLAYKKGLAQASPVLLEPIMKVEVLIPEEYMGDIIGDLNRRRGRILGMNPADKGMQQVVAEVPQAEMFKYATDLRSMTQARGSFKLTFERYEEVPANISAKVIEQAQKEAEE
ncbi:MAG: elongation factor G [Mahellales bacterium]|jgi:elongation factor G